MRFEERLTKLEASLPTSKPKVQINSFNELLESICRGSSVNQSAELEPFRKKFDDGTFNGDANDCHSDIRKLVRLLF